MYNTSLRIVNNSLEAEDIMQESFLSAFEKIETYKGKVSFGAWLKRIVINNSLDTLRKKKVLFEDINKNALDIEDKGNKDQIIDDINIQIDVVREAINKLPDGYRVVLSLYLLEGYDHEEIGEILGISGSTSRSQYTRAKQKLLEYLRNSNKKNIR
jgi:RNA polymerase sigma factor (sigma-70 family)